MGVAGAGQQAAIFRGAGQVAAVAQNARIAAFAALEAQLGNVQPRALQLGMQNAVAQINPVKQRQNVQRIGLDIALPLRVLQIAADGGISRLRLFGKIKK